MSRFANQTALPSDIRDLQVQIEKQAAACGLDFYPVLFEMVNYSQMNEIAAYGGFPTRYPHWRFGMEYERIAKNYEYGLSKIYEMVINNNPSVAYLLEGNTWVDQKLVMAHVYAHVDFFKNNFAFRITDQGYDRERGQSIRKWIDTIANHAATMRRWINRLGIEAIEELIDTCLSLENLIDPQLPFAPHDLSSQSDTVDEESSEELPRLRVDHAYMDPFINPESFVEEQRQKLADDKEKKKKFPETRVRDVLGFMLQHAPLERWERDVVAMIRREAYYFLPQRQTKIMNEGWATYWHSKLMTEELCQDDEIIDYADRCAGVLVTQQGQLNPYKLGVELYRHIEERWNRGQFGKEWEDCDSFSRRNNWDRRTGLGKQKIFEVRALYNDLTFIDEFLTPEFVAEQKMYAFGYNPRHERWEIASRQFMQVKEQLLSSLTNGGNPFIYVDNANHGNRGELMLVHDHMGMDLRMDWAEKCLESLVRLWKRPVELHTRTADKDTALRFDGEEHSKG